MLMKRRVVILWTIGAVFTACRTTSRSSNPASSSTNNTAQLGMLSGGVTDPTTTTSPTPTPTTDPTPTPTTDPKPCGNSTPCAKTQIPDPGASEVNNSFNLDDCSFGFGKFSPYTGTMEGIFSSRLLPNTGDGTFPVNYTDEVSCTGGGEWPAFGQLKVVSSCKLKFGPPDTIITTFTKDAKEKNGSYSAKGCAICDKETDDKKICKLTGRQWEHKASLTYGVKDDDIKKYKYETDLISSLLLPGPDSLIDPGTDDNGSSDEREFLFSILKSWLTGCLPCNAEGGIFLTVHNERKDVNVASFEDPKSAGDYFCGIKPVNPDSCATISRSAVMTVTAGANCEAKIANIPLSKIRFLATGQKFMESSDLLSGQRLTTQVNQISLGQNLTCSGPTSTNLSKSRKFELSMEVAGGAPVSFTCDIEKELIGECLNRELKESRDLLKQKILKLRNAGEKFKDFLNRIKNLVANAVCEMPDAGGGATTPSPM